jgi:hypothetical protein
MPYLHGWARAPSPEIGPASPARSVLQARRDSSSRRQTGELALKNHLARVFLEPKSAQGATTSTKEPHEATPTRDRILSSDRLRIRGKHPRRHGRRLGRSHDKWRKHSSLGREHGARWKLDRLWRKHGARRKLDRLWRKQRERRKLDRLGRKHGGLGRERGEQWQHDRWTKRIGWGCDRRAKLGWLVYGWAVRFRRVCHRRTDGLRRIRKRRSNGNRRQRIGREQRGWHCWPDQRGHWWLGDRRCDRDEWRNWNMLHFR